MSSDKERRAYARALKADFWESSFFPKAAKGPCSLSFFDAGRFVHFQRFYISTGSGWQNNEWPIASIPLFD